MTQHTTVDAVNHGDVEDSIQGGICKNISSWLLICHSVRSPIIKAEGLRQSKVLNGSLQLRLFTNKTILHFCRQFPAVQGIISIVFRFSFQSGSREHKDTVSSYRDVGSVRIWIWLLRKGNIAQCARGSSGWRTGPEKTGCCEILGGAARRNVKQLGPFAELIGSTRVFLKVEINLIKKKKTT